VRYVNNANEEIDALHQINLRKVAVVDAKFADVLKNTDASDASAVSGTSATPGTSSTPEFLRLRIIVLQPPVLLQLRTLQQLLMPL
jgi:hypothetical protein